MNDNHCWKLNIYYSSKPEVYNTIIETDIFNITLRHKNHAIKQCSILTWSFPNDSLEACILTLNMSETQLKQYCTKHITVSSQYCYIICLFVRLSAVYLIYYWFLSSMLFNAKFKNLSVILGWSCAFGEGQTNFPMGSTDMHRTLITYGDTVPGSQSHQAVLPLQGQFVDLPIELAHGNGLGVHGVHMDRLVEGVVKFPAGVQVIQGLLQDLRENRQKKKT